MNLDRSTHEYKDRLNWSSTNSAANNIVNNRHARACPRKKTLFQTDWVLFKISLVWNHTVDFKFKNAIVVNRMDWVGSFCLYYFTTFFRSVEWSSAILFAIIWNSCDWALYCVRTRVCMRVYYKRMVWLMPFYTFYVLFVVRDTRIYRSFYGNCIVQCAHIVHVYTAIIESFKSDTVRDSMCVLFLDWFENRLERWMIKWKSAKNRIQWQYCYVLPARSMSTHTNTLIHVIWTHEIHWKSAHPCIACNQLKF